MCLVLVSSITKFQTNREVKEKKTEIKTESEDYTYIDRYSRDKNP